MKTPKIINDLNSLNPEYIFLVLGLLFGLMIVYANPPFHSNDEDRHFYLAYEYAHGNFEPVVQNDKVGFNLPVNLYNISVSTQGKNYSAGQKVSRKQIDEQKLIPLDEDKKIFYEASTTGFAPISYIGPIIGISVGKGLDDNPISILWAGRTGGLIFYLVIVFFAIRMMPAHKLSMMLVALNPMALYQASSITYDTPILAMTFLIIAYTLKLFFENSTIDLKEIGIILAIALFMSFSKEGYVFVPFIALILPINNFKNKNYYYTMIAGLILAYFIPDWTWGAYYNGLNLPPQKPFIKDFVYGGSQQIDFLTSDPVGAISNIIMNIITQGKEWIWGMLGRFGYSYTVMNKGLLTIYGLILLAVALLENPGKLEFNDKQRYIILGIGVATMALITVGFYALVSPVGSKVIFGLQGRYFIPAIPFLLLAMSNHVVKKEQFLSYQNVIVAGISLLVLSYTVYFLNGNLWID